MCHGVNWPADYSCAPGLTATAVFCSACPQREGMQPRDTYSLPNDVETSLLWTQTDPPCLSPGVGGSVSAERTNHRQEIKGAEKSKKDNTWCWIFRYNHTKSCLHINMLCFCPSEGQCSMGKGILNQAQPVQILTA